jgi:hypothetical protein
MFFETLLNGVLSTLFRINPFTKDFGKFTEENE